MVFDVYLASCSGISLAIVVVIVFLWWNDWWHREIITMHVHCYSEDRSCHWYFMPSYVGYFVIWYEYIPGLATHSITMLNKVQWLNMIKPILENHGGIFKSAYVYVCFMWILLRIKGTWVLRKIGLHGQYAHIFYPLCSDVLKFPIHWSIPY